MSRAACIAFALGCVALAAHAAEHTISFDTFDGWEARPDWLGNAADRFEAVTDDGVVELSVSQPGRGMKWVNDGVAIDAQAYAYLLLRYRATGVVTEHIDYVLWLSDGSSKGVNAILPEDIQADGQWHTLAVDLYDLPLAGAVTGLAVQAQADARGDAHLWLDFISFVEEAPEGAELIQRQRKPEASWRLEFDKPATFTPQPDWLGNDAAEGAYAAVVRDGVVRLSVDKGGTGMKWSLRLPDAPDVGEMPYVAVRYRAHNVAGSGDYFVWLGSEAGGAPQKSAQPMRISAVEDDGEWHTDVAQVREEFAAVELALQVQATADDSWAEIDYIQLSSNRPLFPVSEVLDFRPAGAVMQGFDCVNLQSACNASSLTQLRRWGLSDWLPPGVIESAGVPFRILEGKRDAVATPGLEKRPTAISINAKATEMYLLMSARLPAALTTPFRWASPPQAVREVERFLCEVRYADGRSDFAFPVHIPSRKHQIVRGPAVYAISAQPGKQIAELRLHDRLSSAAFYVSAVTLNKSGKRVWADAPPAATTRPVRVRRKPSAKLRSAVAVRDGTAEISCEELKLSLDTADGLQVREILTPLIGPRGLYASPQDLFTVRVGEETTGSSAVRTGPPSANEGERISAPFDVLGQPLRGVLTARIASSDQIALALSLENTGDKDLRIGAVFPALGPMSLGKAPAGTWYCFPRRGDVINNIPIHLNEPYSGLMPMQFVDVFSADGGGAYVMCQDLNDIYKRFRLDKTKDGVSVRIEWPEVTLQPGQTWESAPIILGGHSGDWHEALAAYLKWVGAWYKPIAPRPLWFRKCFNFRQHFLRRSLTDAETGRDKMTVYRERDREGFGCIDYMHLFDWGDSAVYGRCADYNHYDELGGLDAFKESIRKSQADGVPVGLYIEGYLVNKKSRRGKEHGEAWQIIRADGKPSAFFSTPEEPNYNICPNVPEWQDQMAKLYARVARETGVNGLYIDEFGFGDPGKMCYNEAHAHPIPMPPTKGEAELMRKVRSALPKDVVLYTEEKGNDWQTQFGDGSFTYSISTASDEWSPHHIDLMRFAFPTYKSFQLFAYQSLREGNWAKAKYTFFNGEGSWLQGDAMKGFDDDARAFLSRAFKVLNEHADAFCSEQPAPLVPTLVEGVYANRFPADGETVWTLLNTNYVTVRGPILSVDHRAGATYRDVWNDRPLKPTVKGKRAAISLEIGPRDVGCVAQVRQ